MTAESDSRVEGGLAFASQCDVGGAILNVMDAPKRRWYLPTPAWLVYGAIVVTVVLFASERWLWFPVRYQKGWPVLLAVTLVGAVLILILAWMLVGLLFRKRVQFGLRSLLVFVTLCAVACPA